MGTMQPSSACVGPTDANYAAQTAATSNVVYTVSSRIGPGPSVPWGTLAPTSPARTVTSVAFPPPTGIMATTMYTTPNGTQMSLLADSAYIKIINDISMQHQMLLAQHHGYLGQASPVVSTRPPPPPPFEDGPTPRMLDGDFSEDEMEKAEQIIAELDGVAA